uniref:Cytochrome b n=1 Tax=Heterorhabditis bacteriophora TaxID=37862 RepID=A0A1I7WD70_HETBA
MILLFQIITGTFLAFYYTPDRNLAFSSVNFGCLFLFFYIYIFLKVVFYELSSEKGLNKGFNVVFVNYNRSFYRLCFGLIFGLQLLLLGNSYLGFHYCYLNLKWFWSTLKFFFVLPVFSALGFVGFSFFFYMIQEVLQDFIVMVTTIKFVLPLNIGVKMLIM